MTKKYDNCSWQEIITASQDGDDKALEYMYLRFRPLLRSLQSQRLYKTILGADDTQSIAAFVLIKFVLFRDPMKKVDNRLGKYIKNLMIWRLHDAVRKEKLYNDHTTLVGSVIADNFDNNNIINEVEESVILDNLRQDVIKAVSTLSPSERYLIKARYYNDKSYTAIAKDLQCTTRSIYNMRQRVKKKLTRKLSDWRDYNVA